MKTLKKTLKNSQDSQGSRGSYDEQSEYTTNRERDDIGQDISKTNKVNKKNDIAGNSKQDIKPMKPAQSDFNEANHIGSSDINRTAVAY